MTSSLITRVLAAALLAGAFGSAFATPVMDMRADDLVPMASEFRKELNLNANQQILWQQVESRSKAVLRERHARRERLQQALTAGLGGAKVELRDLNGPLEAEAATSAQEDKALRELWLGVNDALDENQRRQVATMVAEQLMRVPESDQHHAAPRPTEEGKGQHRGMGRKGGGGMGMPGA
jgi:hypothetical protein